MESLKFSQPLIDTENQPARGEKTSAEMVEFRNNQSFEERLAEYITGLQLDDPKFVERLKQDQEIIRDKYGLPPISMIELAPSEFEGVLLSLAKEVGVQVRSEYEVGNFFEEHTASGVYLEKDKVISVKAYPDSVSPYKRRLTILEHELIHAMQDQNYPGMPIEAMEYEAYIANANFDHLDELNPEERVESLGTFFGYMIGGSVRSWYSITSKDRGTEVKPIWDNPQHFLHEVDEIDTNA